MKRKKNYLVQAWLVLALAVGFGAALAGVQVALKPLIDENKRNETYSQIPKLVPGADKAATVELVSADGKIAYKAIVGSEHKGWVIKAVGQGFADKIELLIGLDARAERILGLYVLDQKETPALGNKIVELKWRGQFAGLAASNEVTVVKGKAASGDRNEVAAVTGATVSSESVCGIVNKAVAEFRKKMGSLKEKQDKDKKTEKGTPGDG